MATLSVEELYDRYVRPLSVAEHLRLIAMTTQELAQSPDAATQPPQRSIMELHGLGAELWKDIDAQEYVNELRKEWEHRP